MAEHHGLCTSTMPPPVQQLRGSSHTTGPKIKIIHIVAPEIIKTDVANFQGLVQRLTGRQPTGAGATSSANMSPPPPVEEDNKEMVKKRPPPPPAAPGITTTTAERSDFLVQQEPSSKKRKTIKCKVKVEEGGFGDCGGLLDCNDLWMDLNPGGSFLSFLEEELDVFQGLATDQDFLQLPLGPARMDSVGEMYAS